MKIDPIAFLDLARAKGLTWTETAAKLSPDPEPAVNTKAVQLVESVYLDTVWVVGVETRSEANKRSWKDRSKRTIAARRAVSALFGRTLSHLAPFAAHYHGGQPLGITFSRLAPHRLDRGNVSVALKAVEDAVAMMLGADDGDPRWVAIYEQEHNPRMGVRIQFDLLRARS